MGVPVYKIFRIGFAQIVWMVKKASVWGPKPHDLTTGITVQV